MEEGSSSEEMHQANTTVFVIFIIAASLTTLAVSIFCFLWVRRCVKGNEPNVDAVELVGLKSIVPLAILEG